MSWLEVLSVGDFSLSEADLILTEPCKDALNIL